MSSLFYQAVGVVEGTYVPERSVVVGRDGTIYPASCVPGVRRFFERHPKEAAKARFLVCWPRTSQTGKQVHLTVTAAPVDPDRQASLKREAGRFKVSGMITNQRSRLNRVVVRVVRNGLVPRGKRHKPAFKNHLLFLTGRAAPFALFVNKHTTFTCELKGKELLIRGIEDTREPQAIVYEAGGLKFPWPFMATRKHVNLLCSLNGADKISCIAPADCRDRLQLRLRQIDLLVSERAALQNDADHLITDRLLKIRQRLHNFTRRMGDHELESFLEETGLLAVLSKLQLSPPEPSMETSTAAASISLSKTLEKVAEQVVRGAPDALIARRPGMNSNLVRSSISALMQTEGWWISLSDEERTRAQKGSYQIRKALKQRG